MEKFTRNKLESVMVSTSVENVQYLKDELKSVLESDKPFHSKCDYLGYSILSLDTTMESVDEQIKELQSYKKRLKLAKDTVLTTGAEVFKDYGIDKLDGAGISSITTTKQTSDTKLEISVLNEQALIDGGFYKKVLDTKLLEESYNMGSYLDLIEANTQIERVTTIKPAKLKINKRRAVNSTTSNNISDAM